MCTHIHQHACTCMPHTNTYSCTHNSNKFAILWSQDNSPCSCLLRKPLREDKEKPLLYIFPNVFFPLSDWQNSKCLQCTLWMRIQETNTAHSAARRTHRATTMEGNVTILAKLSILLPFDLPAIPLLEFYLMDKPTHIQNDV